MLRIYYRRYAPLLLHLRYRMYGQRGLPRRLRPEYLYYPSLGITAYAQRIIKPHRPRRYHLHLLYRIVAQTHYRSATVIFLYLAHRRLQRTQLCRPTVARFFQYPFLCHFCCHNILLLFVLSFSFFREAVISFLFCLATTQRYLSEWATQLHIYQNIC